MVAHHPCGPGDDVMIRIWCDGMSEPDPFPCSDIPATKGNDNVRAGSELPEDLLRIPIFGSGAKGERRPVASDCKKALPSERAPANPAPAERRSPIELVN